MMEIYPVSKMLHFEKLCDF